MEIKKSVRIRFLDEEGNANALTISEPKEDISAVDTSGFGQVITENKVLNGKAGFLKEYKGATLIKRTEEELV
jgi:hypothetical protein